MPQNCGYRDDEKVTVGPESIREYAARQRKRYGRPGMLAPHMYAVSKAVVIVLEVELLARIAMALVVVGLLAGAFRLLTLERFFIYFPSGDVTSDPSDYGMAFEDVTLTTSDGVRIHGWFVPGRSDVTWLWLHGNAGNVTHRLDNIRRLHDEVGVGVFIIDYRGYGRSAGRPSEEGTYRDAEEALRYLLSRPDVRPDRIVYFGRSMGAAVATELAVRHAPHGLILETPFPSIRHMAKKAFRFLPVGPLLSIRYDTVSKINRVTSPLLILHGDMDGTVPMASVREVFDAANEPKELYVIQGADHNDTYVVGGMAYFAELRRWLNGLEE